MKLTKIIALLLALTMIFALCACGNDAPASTPADKPADNTPADKPADDQPAEEKPDDTVYTLRYASNDGEESLRHVYLEQPFMDYCTEASGGRIQWEYYPNGSLATNGTIIQGCKDGICDVGMDGPTFYQGAYPYDALFGTPGFQLGDTFEERATNIKTYNDAYVRDELANDCYVLANFPALDAYILSTVEITGVDSFKQMEVATTGNYMALYSNLGASVSGVNYGESYESLRLGVVDMVQAGYGLINNFRLFEVVDYAYYLPGVTSNSCLVISNKVWNSLPDDLKAIMIEGGEKLIFEYNANFAKANEDIVANAVAEGNPNFQFLQLPQDVVDNMMASCEGMIQEKVQVLNDAGKDGDGALALLRSFAE